MIGLQCDLTKRRTEQPACNPSHVLCHCILFIDLMHHSFPISQESKYLIVTYFGSKIRQLLLKYDAKRAIVALKRQNKENKNTNKRNYSPLCIDTIIYECSNFR